MAADNNNNIFEIDTSIILARLHIIACQYLRREYKWKNTKRLHKGMTTIDINQPIQVFNSGIVGMKKLPATGYVDGVTFDLSNKTGIYEVGILIPKMKIQHGTIADNANGKQGLNKGKDNYQASLNFVSTLACEALRLYFIKFLGLYKMRKLVPSDLYGFLVKDHLKTMESYQSYDDYEIQEGGELPDSISTDMTFDNICFKTKYELRADIM